MANCCSSGLQLVYWLCLWLQTHCTLQGLYSVTHTQRSIDTVCRGVCLPKACVFAARTAAVMLGLYWGLTAHQMLVNDVAPCVVPVCWRESSCNSKLNLYMQHCICGNPCERNCVPASFILHIAATQALPISTPGTLDTLSAPHILHSVSHWPVLVYFISPPGTAGNQTTEITRITHRTKRKPTHCQQH
jgi:hypothetical protein